MTLLKILMTVALIPAWSFFMVSKPAAGHAVRAPLPFLRGLQGQGKQAWMRVAPTDEEFTVRMPGTPKVGTETLTVSGNHVTVRYYGHIGGETVYAVLSVSGLGDNMSELAHVLMLNLYNKLVPTSLLDESGTGAEGVKAVYRRDMPPAPYGGREYDIRVRSSAGLWRLYRAGNNFYAVAASTTRKDDASASHFLNSFKLAPPATAVTNTGLPPAPQHARGQKARYVAPSSGSWFVILRTFSKAERAKANRTLNSFLSAGLVANVVDTDDYPKLRGGLIAVLMGPYSRAGANDALRRARAVAPDAYMKPGL